MANVKDLLVNGSARVIGTIYGNATSANKVNHSLTFGSKSFNGSSAQTITLADLGGKPTQSAVSSPSASGTEISFIDTISQNANGVITATKKTVRDASASQSGIVNTGAQTFAGNKTFNNILNFEDSIWLATDKFIGFKGVGQSTSIRTHMGYTSKCWSGSEMHSHGNGGANTTGAFYIQTNGYGAGNDTGGLAIDNEGVTIFGAGDPGDNFTGVFRVINEDAPGNGPMFNVKKTGDTFIYKSLGINGTNLNYRLYVNGTSYFNDDISGVGNIYPLADNSKNLGSSSLKWANIYATTFHGALNGNASTATKLSTARTIQTNLASTAPASFDGSDNITPGVTGTLPVSHGGTGKSSWAGNQLIYSNNANSLANTGSIYTDGSHLGIGVNYSTNFDLLTKNEIKTQKFIQANKVGINVLQFADTTTPKEILIKTKIKYISSATMPKITLHMYAYGIEMPADISIVYYIYNDKICNYGATSSSQFRPYITLSKWIDTDSQEYIAIGLGLIGTQNYNIYYSRFYVDCFEVMTGNDNYLKGWTAIANNTDTSIIPTTNRVHVNYKDQSETTNKLQTGRTIWGQLFDGTANISGNMTGVGNINTASAPAGTIYMNNWFRSTGATGWYNETYGGGWHMTDSTYIRNYNGKSTRLDNLCLGADNNSYRLYIDGTTYVTGQIKSSNSWISIAGTSSFTCPDGTAITQPGGSNPMVLYSGAASGRDCGIFYLSNDNAYIANSSDTGYTFGVFDTDITQNFSTESNASLCVRSGGSGTFIRSRLGVNGINDSYNLYVKGTSYLAGKTYINTSSGTNPLYIARGGSESEAVAMSVDDATYTIAYTNDETFNQIRFRLINTDTEDGTKDNTTDSNIYLDSSYNFYPGVNNVGSIGLSSNKWSNMYATTFHGALDGNANSASKVNNKLIVGSKTYDGSAAVTIAASDLGLASAMLFLGTTTTSITDGATTNPVAIGGANKTVTAGNVVLYGSKEFVWTGSAWEELGNEGSYKVVQAAVADPSASGTSNTFIATISQDANGKITATKKTVAVTNSAPTLAWGTTSTIGTVAGTNLQVTMPANPNVDTKVTQTVTTSNAAYPLLLAPNGQTATATTTSYFDSGVTLNPSTNTIAANISGNANSVSYPAGFNSRLTSWTWGTLTTANGYTQVTDWHTSASSDIGFAEKDGALSVQIDGNFYQGEGRNLVLDSSNYTSYTVTKTGSGASGTWGISITGSANSATKANYLNLYESRGVTTDLNKAANYVAAGAMFHLVASSSTTTGKCPTDANILQMNWDNAGGYDAQIGVSTATPARMYFRSRASEAGAWQEVAHAPVGHSVGSTTTPVYMDSDGVIKPASGTLTNSISGNAATATKFASAQSITLTGDTTGTASSQAGWSISTTTSKLSRTEHLNTVEKLDNFIEAGKIKYATMSTVGGVASDGMVISVPWSSTDWGHQVFLDNSAMVMQHRHKYTKTNSDGTSAQAWSEWSTLLDSNNYTNYTVTKTGTGAIGIWDISVTGNAGSLGSDPTMKLYAQYNNEINFGGRNNSDTIYFGRHATDSKPIPSKFVFGETASGSSELVAAKFTGSLNGNALTAGNSWAPVTNGQTWSRICLLEPTGDNVQGYSGLLHLSCTRGNVVCNASFILNVSHHGTSSRIVQIGGTNYSTFQIRIVTNSNSAAYVEIYDTAYSIAAGTSQIWQATWVSFGYNNITKYTTFTTGATIPSGYAAAHTLNTTSGIVADKVYGAVWNDYAEYRTGPEEFKPGQVVYEVGDDAVSLSTKRLQRGCSIISDTFGFAIGETDKAKCPLAVSGRVLAYGYESIEEFKSHIGYPVCSGPNGTVSIMTDEEEEKYPSRIIGIISAVPEYEEWGTGKVKVDGRIWIKVK